MVSREDVRYAYLFLLGREPESEESYIAHEICPDIHSLRNQILHSDESVLLAQDLLKRINNNCSINYFRPVTIFIHIEKTGGTSLTHALGKRYGSSKFSPPHFRNISLSSMGELNGYDLITGHITYDEAMAIPRHPKRVVTMLREPILRLISFYRFHRLHPEWARVNPLIALAQDLDPASYFENDLVRTSPQINNAYLETFANCSHSDISISSEERLDIALNRISLLSCVGILENLSETVSQMTGALDLPEPLEVPRLHVSDELHRQQFAFSQAAEVTRDKRLLDAIAPLVEFDEIIYRAGRSRLETETRSGHVG